MRRRTVSLAFGIGIILLVAACGSAAAPQRAQARQPTLTPPSPVPTASPGPTQLPHTLAPPIASGATDPAVSEYVAAAERSINLIMQTAQFVSGFGIQLTLSDVGPVETADIVSAAVGSFTLAKESLNSSEVPEGLELLHEAINNAVDLYVQATEALLADPKAAEFDYFTFQNLFQQ